MFDVTVSMEECLARGFVYHNLVDKLDHAVIHSNSKYNPKVRYIFNKHSQHVLGFDVPLRLVGMYWALYKFEQNLNSLGDEFSFAIAGKCFLFRRDTFVHNANILKPKLKQALLYAYTNEEWNINFSHLEVSRSWKDLLVSNSESEVLTKKVSLQVVLEEYRKQRSINADDETIVKAIFNLAGMDLT